MRQTIVGVYELGYEQVQIVLREGTGGEFWMIPEKGSLPRIKIGADYPAWNEVVNVLLHEVFEFLLARMKCRFECCNDLSKDHSNYSFFLTHVQFSDLCWKAADCIAPALPDIAKVYANWNKKPKKKNGA